MNLQATNSKFRGIFNKPLPSHMRGGEASGKFFVIFSPPSCHLLFPQLLQAKGISVVAP